MHQLLLTFHNQLTTTHLACAKWYTWPLLIKPISYWYVESEYTGRGTLVQAVNNLGNPALWGFSAATVLLVLAEWRRAMPTDSSVLSSVRAYLLIGYLSNWLPWAGVERCTYNYLFMPAAVFGFMALALAMSEWLCGPVFAVSGGSWNHAGGNCDRIPLLATPQPGAILDPAGPTGPLVAPLVDIEKPLHLVKALAF